MIAYIKNIIVFVLFLSILEELILNQEYKKYVRFFAGLIFILIVLNPLSSFQVIEDEIDNYFEEKSEQIEEEDLQKQVDQVVKQKISSAYQNYTEKEIENSIRKMGKKDIKAEVRQGEDEKIEEVEIYLKEKEQNQADIEKIKKYVNEVYQVELEHIHITIMR